MRELFPLIQPETMPPETEKLPLYREVAWNFEKGQPIFQAGNPITVEGLEAVRTWIWKALVTERTRYEIYTWDFGNELESLIGQPFSEELKRAEAARYVRECLEINPYITGVSDISATFLDGRMTLSVRVETIYGEAKLNV